jgi:hypothetical protein
VDEAELAPGPVIRQAGVPIKPLLVVGVILVVPQHTFTDEVSS